MRVDAEHVIDTTMVAHEVLVFGIHACVLLSMFLACPFFQYLRFVNYGEPRIWRERVSRGAEIETKMCIQARSWPPRNTILFFASSICHAITDPPAPVTKIRLWASFGV